MAGSLVKIDEEIVTSAVASVTLTGIDSTYDVYMVRINNATVSANLGNITPRVTVSGTADSTANYDIAGKQLKSNTTFGNSYNTNQTSFTCFGAGGTGTGEQSNIIMYLFNFNNASEYSFITFEEVMYDQNPFLLGNQGGGVHTVAQSCDGIEFKVDAGAYNFTGGNFVLYGLKK